MNVVSHFDDVDYSQRVADVVVEVCAAVPEIAASVADLPARMTRARNDLAHQLVYDGNEPLGDRTLRWLVVTQITLWLLRGLLLLRTGVKSDVLRVGYLESNRFEFHQANIAHIVDELGWELPMAPK